MQRWSLFVYSTNRYHNYIVYRPTYKSKFIVNIERGLIVLRAYASLAFIKEYKKASTKLGSVK